MNAVSESVQVRWALLSRMADVIAHEVAQMRPVMERRLVVHRRFHLAPPPDVPGLPGTDKQRLVEECAEEWSALFDSWNDNKQFVFPCGYAVLFFVSVLWSGTPVAYRGQLRHEWELTSSLERIRADESMLATIKRVASEFTGAVLRLNTVRLAYRDGVPASHVGALLQHYGFPTSFIDFTLCGEVGLFFAEGATSRVPPDVQVRGVGGIYAVPLVCMPASVQILVLPSEIPRPTAQRAMFLGRLTPVDKKAMESHKYAFEQHHVATCSGVGYLPFGSPVPVESYLLPVHDSIELLAQEFRKRLQGMT